jgi:uncharacterized membrane protein
MPHVLLEKQIVRTYILAMCLYVFVDVCLFVYDRLSTCLVICLDARALVCLFVCLFVCQCVFVYV